MIELLKLWEELRVSETNATNVLLPTAFYSKPSLISLCENYSNINEKCGLGRCHVENPVTSFVQRHLSFVCQKEMAIKFFENQQCITNSLMKSNCTAKIREDPRIGGEIYCSKMDEFVKCVEEPLRTSCGNEAYALVMKSVETYGCPEKIDIARVNEFLNLKVETATIEVMTTPSAPLPGKQINMRVTASLDVEDQNKAPVQLEKEVMSSTATESTSTSTSTTLAVATTTIFEGVIVDDVRESSGEIPEETTVVANTVTQPVEKERPKRKQFNVANMTDCYTSIVGDFGRFLHSSPTSSFVRFPLFGIKPMELEVLCAKFEVATECVNSFCVGNCRLPPIKSFVDSQLKETCAMRDQPDFELEFTCLQNVLKENSVSLFFIIAHLMFVLQECVNFLNSTTPNRCDGHPQFRSCIIERLLGDCSEETLRLMDKMSSGFGCKLLIELDLEEPEASGEFEGSGSGDFEEENGSNFNANQTEEALLTREVVPKTCEGGVKASALSCLAPLLRLWTGIKENRKDTEVVFPIFEFSKIELLELCDAFANYRNCVKFTDSGVCRMEPVINFTEEHFGQVCTTQQIEASMRTHDCINAIDYRDLAICNKYSKGETLPGKRKCPKVRRYTKCLRKLVANQCGHLMLAQFDMIVHRFGC
uniref:DUF19 domain-containing protein n=1 Tax=Caenorhabditis japonica TaxID=281687 RepID=A0A8R1HSM7_CAEJA